MIPPLIDMPYVAHSLLFVYSKTEYNAINPIPVLVGLFYTNRPVEGRGGRGSTPQIGQGGFSIIFLTTPGDTH